MLKGEVHFDKDGNVIGWGVWTNGGIEGGDCVYEENAVGMFYSQALARAQAKALEMEGQPLPIYSNDSQRVDALVELLKTYLSDDGMAEGEGGGCYTTKGQLEVEEKMNAILKGR